MLFRSGIFAAVWVAVAGFAVLPYYKRKSQREFQRRLAEVETALTASLEKSLRDEVAGLTGRMKSVVRPLREFDQAKVSLKSDQLSRIVSVSAALEKLQDASKIKLKTFCHCIMWRNERSFCYDRFIFSQ